MTSNCLPRVFALAPIGSEGLAIAAAASRAGAFGIVNLSTGSVRAPEQTFSRIRLLTARPFGVLIAVEHILAKSLFESGNDLPDAICLPVRSADPLQLADVAQLIQGANRIAIAEVTTRADAALARQAGFDGLILSGHESGGWCGAESSFVLLQGVLADGDVRVWVRGGIGPCVAAGCIAAGAAGVVLDGACFSRANHRCRRPGANASPVAMAVIPPSSFRARAPACEFSRPPARKRSSV